MKSTRKYKIILIAAAVLLVLCAVGAAISRMAGDPVKVALVSSINSGGMGEQLQVADYGTVTTSKNQEIDYDDSLIVTEVHVAEGDTVKIGDPLITYDTSLVKLEVEMKEMQIEGMGLNIKNMQAELKKLRKNKKGFVATGTGKMENDEEGRAFLMLSSDSSDNGGDSDTPSQGDSQVYTEITEDSEPFKGTGTKDDPFYYYIIPENTDTPVQMNEGYIRKALKNKWYAFFYTVSDKDNPQNTVVSTWAMDFETLEDLVKQEMGNEFPAELAGKTIYDKITSESQPYQGEGTAQNPYRYLCLTEASADAVFLKQVLDHHTVHVFDVVDDKENPKRILYSWTLDGTAASEPQQPQNPSEPQQPSEEKPQTQEEKPQEPEEPEGGVDIPEEREGGASAQQIREMQEDIQELEVDRKLARLELKKLKKKLDNGVVTSTVNGTVKLVLDEKEAKLGNEPLIRVVGEEGLYVSGTIAETALEKLDPGMTLTVTSWESGESYEATVTDVGTTPVSGGSSEGNPNMSYYSFSAVVRGDADLKSGDGVGISVKGMDTLDYEDELYLSQAFVRQEGNRYYVYKKGKNDRLEKQYIEVGKVVYGTMEIKGGIDMEDEIAFPYGRDVKEGAKTKTVDSLYDEVGL